MRCPKCGDYSLDVDDGCRNCGYKPPKAKPPSWWGSSDLSKRDTDESRIASRSDSGKKLSAEEREAKLRKLFVAASTGHYIGCTCAECTGKTEKQQTPKDATEAVQTESAQVAEGQESKCPKCGQISLVWNRYFVYYECKSCKKTFAQNEIEVDTIGQPPKPTSDQIPVHLQVCPSCKQQSLMLNENNNRYECLNGECRESFAKVAVDKFNQQVLVQKKLNDDLTEKETKAWLGDQYYDPKKKQWRDGEKPIRVRWRHNRWWLWIIIPLIFVLISVIVTLILNYFHPGSKFSIFGW